jgi:hypothetical protein
MYIDGLNESNPHGGFREIFYSYQMVNDYNKNKMHMVIIYHKIQILFLVPFNEVVFQFHYLQIEYDQPVELFFSFDHHRTVALHYH